MLKNAFQKQRKVLYKEERDGSEGCREYCISEQLWAAFSELWAPAFLMSSVILMGLEIYKWMLSALFFPDSSKTN